MDILEDQRIILTEKILEIKEPEDQYFLKLKASKIEDFIRRYKDTLEIGDIEKKKAVLRSLIDSAKLVGDKLEIFPDYKK